MATRHILMGLLASTLSAAPVCAELIEYRSTGDTQAEVIVRLTRQLDIWTVTTTAISYFDPAPRYWEIREGNVSLHRGIALLDQVQELVRTGESGCTKTSPPSSFRVVGDDGSRSEVVGCSDRLQSVEMEFWSVADESALEACRYRAGARTVASLVLQRRRPPEYLRDAFRRPFQ